MDLAGPSVCALAQQILVMVMVTISEEVIHAALQ